MVGTAMSQGCQQSITSPLRTSYIRWKKRFDDRSRRKFHPARHRPQPRRPAPFDGFDSVPEPAGSRAPGTHFDSFVGTVKKIGAQPILIANYGTGTPEEAAGWVRYANVTKGYGAKYWEIGNENYGNGYYGADWEADNHASK